MEEHETRTKIMEYLLENGETPLCEFKIQGTTRKAISNHLLRMHQEGTLDRRKINSKFSYSIRDKEDFYVNNEPGYAYYLRNLPREMNHEC